MLIEYIIIFLGDKANIPYKGFLSPESEWKVKIDNIYFCCEGMRQNWNAFIFDEMLKMLRIMGTNENIDNEIKYCPYCGKEVKFKEVKRVKLKKITKRIVDYIEEEVKEAK